MAEPGQTVALVGPTGSGKSTILGLIAKFHLPGAGEVAIDGRDIRTLTGDGLRQQMGNVLQNNFLFSGTVHGQHAHRPPRRHATTRSAPPPSAWACAT